MARTLLVSNRLPVTATMARGQVLLTRSSGGLASALRVIHEREESLWIGWPGELPSMNSGQRRQLEWQMAGHRVVPVMLSRAHIRGFYEEVANGVLWPVSHCLLDQLPLEMGGWETYRAVNERYADAVAAQYLEGDTIWVHDYHLMLLPALLRERLPEARIGYFHHIPFPPADVFQLIPWRADLLRGLLGADLVGFQTADHVQNFTLAVQRVLGLPSGEDAIFHGDRVVGAAAFPIGIDAEEWASLALTSAAREEAARYHDTAPQAQLLVGVDRLDYTKGILRRLLAFERVLEQEPEMRDRLRLVQVTVPSREGVRAYASLKRKIDELVGRINGKYGTPHQMPVHRVHGHLAPHELAGLYLAADVLLATPLRDGMNLVAKEFVATRSDGDAVLVLSEFAGAAEQLTGALQVNPYDLNGMALATRRALRMPQGERQARMATMRRSVASADVHHWAAGFMQALEGVTAGPHGSSLLDEEQWERDVKAIAIPI